MVRIAGFVQRSLDKQLAGFVARRRAADRIAALDHQHLAALARQDRAGRQAAKAGADHHYIITRHSTPKSCNPKILQPQSLENPPAEIGRSCRSGAACQMR